MSDEDILDVIDACGYGIVYWCHLAEIDENARTYTIHSDHMPMPVELSFDRIAELASKYDDVADIDSIAGDILIQTAVFGDVIFG